jgi:hypothetical protein
LELNTFSITNVAYQTTITDVSVLGRLKINNGETVVKQKNKNVSESENEDTSFENHTGGGFVKKFTYVVGERRTLWDTQTKYPDTSSRYRLPGVNVDLWSRIFSNSGGSLPRPINKLGGDEISSKDRDAVKSYTTPSRGIRKCCLALFVACATSAAIGIGCFEGAKKRPYSIQPVERSVNQLSKSTSAGTDTMGKKNDPKVQRRTIAQIKDLFKNPTLRKAVGLNALSFYDYIGSRIYGLPETIFHRFQGVYNELTDVCDVKSRLVWCVPYVIVALENMFFGPILNSVKETMLRENECIYPIGLLNSEIGENCVGTLRDKYRLIGSKSNHKIYSLDFSKFDQSIPQFVKDIFFSIFSSVIDFNSLPNSSHIYNYLRVYVKYTPFIYKDEILFKQKGISSGLFITNLFDTIWNLTLHIFTNVVERLYPHLKDAIINKEIPFDKLFVEKNEDYIRSIEQNGYIPFVRVMGDDSIVLCTPETLHLFTAICRVLGMSVTVKHVCEHPDSPIFFLGRYWDKFNLPFQTDKYIALHIVFTRWYEKKDLPFDLRDLHLNRMLSICLPLKGGKEFLDKYLFDYEPYRLFLNSNKGFTYMKDFIENTFRYVPREKVFLIDSY